MRDEIGRPGDVAGFQPARHKVVAATFGKAPAAVRGRLDVPIDELDDALPALPRDAGRLDELAARYGVTDSVQRLHRAITATLDRR